MWRPILTADSSWTLAHPVHGEPCHSLAGAWQESLERYAAPCRLREMASAGRSPIRLLDIGTGLGLNLAAALCALEGTGALLDAVSLELDPAVLSAALELPPQPAELERWHGPVREALRSALAAPLSAVRDGLPLASRGRLRLLLGDARATLFAWGGAEPFDAVFLDPFSPRVDPSLWEPAFLGEVARRMGPEAILSSFSASFGARLGLLRAGLSVGRGPRVGSKGSGTLASHGAPLPALDCRTARRLARALVRAPAAARGAPGGNSAAREG